ncbi:FGGY-family carbohydrate kinase [Occultella gossypii]|uniref:Carbohydrate kinase n=1 Tax=Occultella gossypii TaxID=2800820 RepID=A0ABS7SDJ1_9MICO|nr:FGGY-family carbohydrate kinase [Occultella gossypii]MBZ2197968.1 carbohydrate kinase [Occultella gossypii]
MTQYVLGIDSGSSTVKVTLHTDDGSLVASVAEPTPMDQPWPDAVERDPEAHWAAVAGAVRRLVAHAGVRAGSVAAIGLAGHGDGVHLVDNEGRPVGPALLSQDTRAAAVLDAWAADGTLAELRNATGQVPFPGSPAPLLRWLDRHEPERLARARWVLAAKDWIRLRMTGEIATDRTDAGGSFADLDSHEYSERALQVTGLEHLAYLLPPVLEPTAVAGHLLPAAASELGLPAGIPVATGLHDVAATVLGTVGTEPGRLCVIAGTFGVNVVLVDRPVRNELLNTRPGPFPGTWTVRRTARASGASVAWAAKALLGERGTAGDVLDLAFQADLDHDPPTFVPFVFGGTADQPGYGSFFGLRSWHGREAMLRSVVECIAFNHCHDVGVVRDSVPVRSIHLAGGLTRDSRWNQLLADALDEEISCTRSDDTGARGAATTAAVAAGLAADLPQAVERFRAPSEQIAPGPAAPELRRRLRRFRDILSSVRVLESQLDMSESTSPMPTGVTVREV